MGDGAHTGRLLVVDDDDVQRRALSRLLRFHGHEVDEASSGAVALGRIDTQSYDCVLSDILMPDLDGLALLHEVRKRDPDVPVLLITGAPAIDTAVRAIELGANQYLLKPTASSELLSAVRRWVQQGKLSRVRREAESLLRYSLFPFDVDSLKRSFRACLDALWIAYQPIVHMQSAELAGYEALVRSRATGMEEPGAILSAAERLNGLTSLGRLVRSLAAQPFVSEPRDGLLFVNLHPRDLEDPSLRAHTSPLTKIASQVVLEITERASLASSTDLRRRIGELREMGYRIALDDIGAGYAGLGTFAMLEPDIVKLDMSLVRSIDEHPVKERVVRSLNELCHSMNILVVAEGIETSAEWNLLQEIGCDLAQGFLFAQPGPAFPPLLGTSS